MPGMTLNQGPALVQTQQQALTMRQMQSMKLLQYSALELQEYIAQIQTQNPAIEVVSNMEELSGDMFEDSFNMRDDDASYSDGEVSEEYQAFRMDSITESKSLYEVLLEQLGDLMERDEEVPLFRACREVLGNLDPNGYLDATDEEIAKAANVSEEQAAEAVAFIQQNIEPAGIGGHDVRECLMIQLQRKDEKESTAWKILDSYWTALQKHRLEFIADELDMETEEVEDAIAAIKELNPTPGASLDSSSPTQFVCPEVAVIRRKKVWEIIPINSSIPTVTISPDYEEMLKDKKLSKEARQAIVKYIDEGKQLINDLEFRKTTLVRITEALLKLQPGYFAHGLRELKPMGQEDVASLLNLSVSTISRAISNKYMQLACGPVGYKSLFQQQAGGEDMTNLAVKQKLKELIECENHTKPYSDQKLTELLEAEGVHVSRRVVNKYREALGYPAAAGRRKLK